MPNYFDQFDKNPGESGNYFDQFDPGAKPKKQDGQMVSGFKRAFEEVPGMLAGVGAFAADVVGADETRDKLLGYAKQKSDEVGAKHANDAQSITDAWDGKVGWLDFLANASGYVAGQALQSIATGGLGAIGAKMLAKHGAKEMVEAAAAKAIAAGATEEVAKKAAIDALMARGAVAGAGAHNFGMELGSIYPDAVEQAEKDGRTLDAGDKLKVFAAASLAAGVDTAGEAIMAGRVFKGSKAPGSMLGRAAREVPAGMAREAGTEAAQTGIEQWGAAKPFDMREIVDSAGIGAVGGGLGGAGASLRARAPEAAAPAPAQPTVSDIAAAPDIDTALAAFTGSLALPGPAQKVDNWEVVDGMQALPAPPQQPGMLSLPAPTGPQPIMVDSQGNAAPMPSAVAAEGASRAAEREQQVAEERAGLQSARQEQADIGLTPDVLAAQYARTEAPAVRQAADQQARVEQAAAAPVDRAERTGSAEGRPVLTTEPVSAFIDSLRQQNTPASRAYVAEFEAGRITPEDVKQRIARETPKTDAQVADERLAAAAKEAPKPSPDDLVTADGFPYGTRSGAVIRAKREGLPTTSVIEVAGGYAVRTKEPTNDQPDVAGTPAQPVPAADGASPDAGGSVGAVGSVPDLRGGVVRASDAPVASGQQDQAVADGGVDNDALKRESRGPAASRAWVDEGKTPEQLLQDRIEGPASELAFQVAEEARAQDFAPSELPMAVEAWAKDANVPTDQFRETLLRNLDKTDLSDARKAQVRKALSPLRERAMGAKSQPEQNTPEAYRARLKSGAESVGMKPGAMPNSFTAEGKPTTEGVKNSVSVRFVRDGDRLGGQVTVTSTKVDPATGRTVSAAPSDPKTIYGDVDQILAAARNAIDGRGPWASPQADTAPPAAAAKERNGQAQEEPQEGVLKQGAAADTKTAAPEPPSLKDRAEALKPSREQIELKKRLAVLNRLKECIGS